MITFLNQFTESQNVYDLFIHSISFYVYVNDYGMFIGWAYYLLPNSHSKYLSLKDYIMYFKKSLLGNYHFQKFLWNADNYWRKLILITYSILKDCLVLLKLNIEKGLCVHCKKRQINCGLKPLQKYFNPS